MQLARIVVTLAAAGSILVFARFRMPENAPVDRLIANMMAYVKAHPRDAHGYYVLGRIHYLAFALNARELRAFGNDEPYNNFHVGQASGQPADPLPDRERNTHLTEALRWHKKAIELEPGNGLYELGLACVFEDGHPDADWREQAIAHYLTAYHLSINGEQQMEHKPLHGLGSLVSYEAGSSYVRLVRERGVKDSEMPELEQIETAIAAMEKLPHGPITPIVLTLRTDAALSGVLAPELRVSFDLDGTGRAQIYPWLQPDAAFLVWDPEHTGLVSSGRQLFGTVTWWMFWEDGYHALAALDNDRDGWLRGAELQGLALWFDRNQNGVCDLGEVIPVEQAGIEAIAVRADGFDGASPMNPAGLRMKDGRVLPTWDWVATPIQ